MARTLPTLPQTCMSPLTWSDTSASDEDLSDSDDESSNAPAVEPVDQAQLTSRVSWTSWPQTSPRLSKQTT